MMNKEFIILIVKIEYLIEKILVFSQILIYFFQSIEEGLA